MSIWVIEIRSLYWMCVYIDGCTSQPKSVNTRESNSYRGSFFLFHFPMTSFEHVTFRQKWAIICINIYQIIFVFFFNRKWKDNRANLDYVVIMEWGFFYQWQWIEMKKQQQKKEANFSKNLIITSSIIVNEFANRI